MKNTQKLSAELAAATDKLKSSLYTYITIEICKAILENKSNAVEKLLAQNSFALDPMCLELALKMTAHPPAKESSQERRRIKIAALLHAYNELAKHAEKYTCALSLDKVLEYIKSKQNLNIFRDRVRQQDPLYNAIKNNDLEEARRLLSSEDVMTFEREYLDDAVEKGHVFLSDALELANHEYLFEAVKNNNVEIVKLLLEKGADVNLEDDNENYTPLHYAVWGFDTQHAQAAPRMQIIELLLKAGANINAQGDACCCMLDVTPLHIAAIWNGGNKEIVCLLLAYDADTTIKNYDGYTALEEALCYATPKCSQPCEHHSDLEIIKMLQERTKNEHKQKRD